MDIGALVNISSQSGMAGSQQLPSASMNDVKRFDDILKYGSTDTVNPSAVDNTSILQLQKADTTASGDFKSLLINKAADMDSAYHNLLTRFDNMPRYTDYLAQNSGMNADMRTYPNVSTKKDYPQLLQESVNQTQATLSASSDYQRMLTRWGISMNMWSSKMTIVTTAVSQVSQGFKTLFRAAG